MRAPCLLFISFAILIDASGQIEFLKGSFENSTIITDFFSKKIFIIYLI
ncbi:MAG: hypothetical protein LBI78_04105 [Campylobacteraceae bacterium]|nr:hypothetical protein [Campylobacteraceae bacterium]